MGRHLWRRHSYVRLKEEDTAPGCIWVLLRFLHSHRWLSHVKRLLPHRKPGPGVPTSIQKGNGKPKQRHKIQTGRAQEFEEGDKNSVPTVKKSIRARFGALIPDVVSFMGSNPERSVSNSPKQQTQLTEPLAHEHMDVLALFQVEHELFQKLLQDKNPNLGFPTDFLSSRAKRSLNKSGSFPAPNSSSFTRLRTISKLDHKYKEIWPVPKEEKDMGDMKSKSMIKKSASLNESTDKYSKLFDNMNAKREIKGHLSRSLTVSSEKDYGLGEHPRRSFKRRLSLPEIPYFTTTITSESYRENNGEAEQIGPVVDEHSVVETVDSCEGTAERCEEEKEEEGRDNVLIGSSNEEHGSSNSVLETCSDAADQISSPKFLISQGVQLEPRNHHFHHPDPLPASNLYNVRNKYDPFEQSLRTEMGQDYNAELYYIKYILDQLGITGSDQLEPWESLNRPLSPELLEEINCFTGPTDQNCDSRLLFDLVIDALDDMYESSSTYYPRSLNLNCQVRALPRQGRVLGEVWARVSQDLRWRPELDPGLDQAMAGDLNEKNGWMNRQVESECVGLELEDLIFDELLDEIVC